MRNAHISFNQGVLGHDSGYLEVPCLGPNDCTIIGFRVWASGLGFGLWGFRAGGALML